MTRNDPTRIVLEGALNGIGFVIGTAILSGIVSFIFLHIFAVIILPLIGIALWFSFKGRRMLKDRLERMRVEPLPRAIERQ